MSAVLDASAVVALAWQEPGADLVRAALPGAVLSAINESEVFVALLRAGASVERAGAIVAVLDLTVIAVDGRLGAEAARLEPLTRAAGLSLGDRCCLALARRLQRPAVTADRSWARIAGAVGVEVRLIR